MLCKHCGYEMRGEFWEPTSSMGERIYRIRCLNPGCPMHGFTFRPNEYPEIDPAPYVEYTESYYERFRLNLRAVTERHIKARQALATYQAALVSKREQVVTGRRESPVNELPIFSERMSDGKTGY